MQLDIRAVIVLCRELGQRQDADVRGAADVRKVGELGQGEERTVVFIDGDPARAGFAVQPEHIGKRVRKRLVGDRLARPRLDEVAADAEEDGEELVRIGNQPARRKRHVHAALDAVCIQQARRNIRRSICRADLGKQVFQREAAVQRHGGKVCALVRRAAQ